MAFAACRDQQSSVRKLRLTFSKLQSEANIRSGEQSDFSRGYYGNLADIEFTLWTPDRRLCSFSFFNSEVIDLRRAT